MTPPTQFPPTMIVEYNVHLTFRDAVSTACKLEDETEEEYGARCESYKGKGFWRVSMTCGEGEKKQHFCIETECVLTDAPQWIGPVMALQKAAILLGKKAMHST